MPTNECTTKEIYKSLDPDIKQSLFGLLILYSEPCIRQTDNISNLVTRLDVPWYPAKIHSYIECVHRLLNMNPQLWLYLSNILESPDDMVDPISLDCMKLPRDATATDIIMHIAMNKPSLQLFETVGLDIKLFDPSIHYLHIKPTNGGYYMQGIYPPKELFNFEFVVNCFDEHTNKCGHFIPDSKIIEFCDWIKCHIPLNIQ